MRKMTLTSAVLTPHDANKLRVALGVAPEDFKGIPFAKKVRRGQIERRRLSIVKAEVHPSELSESQELFKLCTWDRVKEAFDTVAYAVRSTVSGDYWVYSREEW